MTMERNEFTDTPARDAISARRLLARRQRYDHPQDVLVTALDADDKRAILASWASDLFAVESRPDLRKPPGIRVPIRCEDILDALQSLDEAGWAGNPALDRQRQPGRPS